MLQFPLPVSTYFLPAPLITICSHSTELSYNWLFKMQLLVKIVFTLSFLQIVSAGFAELQKKSHTEEFEGASALFRAMSSSPNDGYTYNWNVVTYPIDDHLNCTVLYLDQCTSWNRCRQTCLKTGATSYRWFHDGCCECVGEHCMNNGINESRCRLCPEPGLEDEED